VLHSLAIFGLGAAFAYLNAFVLDPADWPRLYVTNPDLQPEPIEPAIVIKVPPPPAPVVTA
jgi:hypothetical protein